MTESAVISFTDKDTPPPDDPAVAPYGWRWDGDAWVAKRSAGGRKPRRGRDEEASPGRDPDPAYLTGDAPSRPRPAVTAAVKKDITAAVGLMAAMTGPAVVRWDPYCGMVLTENMQAIVDAVVPLLCGSERVVRFFADTAGGSDWLLWFKLAMALFPVAQAIGAHHVFGTVTIVTQPDGHGGFEQLAVPAHRGVPADVMPGQQANGSQPAPNPSVPDFSAFPAG